MTVEHAHSTNGRVHLDQAELEEQTKHETRPGLTPQPSRRRGRGRILMPLLLVLVAVVMLWRLQRGNVL